MIGIFFAGLAIGFFLGLAVISLMFMATENDQDQGLLDQAMASYEKLVQAKAEKERERHATL